MMLELLEIPRMSFFKDFFDVDHFLKSSLNLLQHCFCFMLWFFDCEACGILAPSTGIEPTPSALESFPGGSDGKVSACNVEDPDLIPGLGRSPGEGNGSPLQYTCLENPMDRGAW